MSAQAVVKRLVVICGPTASGKTDLAIELAARLNTEIVSADSRQLYREIPIGTAQPTAEQLARVRHHFIAERSVCEDYNAGMFEREALLRLKTLFEEHDTVVCCGGTGLYIKALCDGLDEMPPADPDLRTQLAQRLRTEGLAVLQAELKSIDPVHYQRMDIHNPQRVIRALEVCLSSGRPFSSFHGKARKERPFAVVKVAPELPRDVLYERIDRRVETMLRDGWLQEAESVYLLRHCNALNTVGYKELFQYLDATLSLEQAVEKIKVNTRRFAKRQLTWFKRDQHVRWLLPGQLENLLSEF